MYLFREFNIWLAALALLLWSLGGWLMTARTFRLEKVERTLTAVAVGILVNIWLANLAAQVLPLPLAFWVSTAAALLAGLGLAWPLDRDLLQTLPGNWKHWLAFLLMAYFLTLIGRGLGIYDDYQSLPALSIMATGDVPPHFILDPKISFGYHYYLLLFGTQFMQMADSVPWTAMDIVRSITFALTLLLGGLWTRRITGSRLAGFLAVPFLAFAAGMRWILLLIPRALLDVLSGNVHFYGAAFDEAGGSIADLLVKTRGLPGAGVFPQPYFLLNGLDNPLVLALASYGTTPLLILILLLMLANQRANRRGYVVLGILLASLALANEVTFGFLYLGLGLALLIWILRQRREKPLRQVLPEIAVLALAGAAAIAQGGMFTSMLVNRLTPGASMVFDISFRIGLPALFDAHFGALSLVNPYHWLLILAEAGPTLLLVPVVIVWGWRMAKQGQWWAAGVALSVIASLLTTMLTYSGNVAETATTRLTGHMLMLSRLFAIALLWNWASRRSEGIRQALIGLGLAASVAGLSIFTLQIASAQTPQYSYFLTQLDAKMYEKYWNELEPEALVFDSAPFRAPTVFGRFTDVARTWEYLETTRWEELIQAPTPFLLRAAGFSYLYLDERDWLGYSEEQKLLMQAPCVQEVERMQDGTNFRLLLDIHACTSP